MNTKVRYITKGKEYRRSEYQMKQILIATHGKMASGIRYTAELIVGKMDGIENGRTGRNQIADQTGG